jgi:PAS domain S-box-containing protein
MNERYETVNPIPVRAVPVATLIALAPVSGRAQTTGFIETLPGNISTPAFIAISGLTFLGILLFFILKKRLNHVSLELDDVTRELSQTRSRLTETSKTLERSQLELKNTTERYQGILFEAGTGMFQMDLQGKCTYINSALQEMSGLYPKKALKEGLESAIHPSDLETFKAAWATFVEKDNVPFDHCFRFKHTKGREVHVICKAHKILNAKKDVESYIGWISDVTPFHEAQQEQQKITNRYATFIEHTVEGYYHLAAELPIPLAAPEQMAKEILENMKLVSCNNTFSAMLGESPSHLIGKTMNAIPGGCGPFKDIEMVTKFAEAQFSLMDFESVRQDPRGNRLSLLNNIIGLVEDGKLVGIWGSQRNISQQKREKAELTSQTEFMRRILNALPADVHVKDTRCRYLYASKKLADRTGIAQENWIGKTIFEVIPATPREHDKTAIEVMKSGRLNRIERPYEARGKSGWMETVQIPLMSEDGLVEGVVGLSFDISERKKREEQLRHHLRELEERLNQRTQELQKTQSELGQTAIALRSTNQKLRIRETEFENRSHEFKKQLEERKQVEQALRKNEETLLTRQTHLEKQLEHRAEQLAHETDKRKKWEELITIKEDELHKVEEAFSERQQLLARETELREKFESDLAATQSELSEARRTLELLRKEHEQQIAAMTENQKKEYGSAHEARARAESQLQKATAQLAQTQEKIKQMSDRHAAELEHEVAERKNATTKLVAVSEELDTLKHQFNERIEEETKRLKQEIAQKQIREKTMRQHEKDLDNRIKELEKSLNLKAREHDEQVQALEGAEVQRRQVEQKLDQLTKRQQELVERETQKMKLHIAEIRLEEVKLRTQVSTLEEANETLEAQLAKRVSELEQAKAREQQIAKTLAETQAHLHTVEKDIAAQVEKETGNLKGQLEDLKQTEAGLRRQEDILRKQSAELENQIHDLEEQLKVEAANRKAAEDKLGKLEVAFQAGQENVSKMVDEATSKLTAELQQHKQIIAGLQKDEASLQKEAVALEKTIQEQSQELTEARKAREQAEKELAETIARAGQDVKENEKMFAALKQEHAGEIQRIMAAEEDLRLSEKHYRSLFGSSAQAMLQLDPMSGEVQSANLSATALFGLESMESWSKQTLEDLSPSHQASQTPSKDMVRSHLHTALENNADTFEWEFHRADGTPFHTLVSLSLIETEKDRYMLAAILDISDIKQRQDELQQTLDEAYAANRLNSNVVDEVTESVQTALVPVVKKAAQLEKSESLPPEQKLDIAMINRNCRSLIDTMEYRHELSHLADGNDEVVPVKCDLHQLIKELDQQFAHRAETKKMFFAVSYAQYQSANNVPKLVETDEGKLRSTLSILLGYAMDQTEKGRLGLHAATKKKDDDAVDINFELTYTAAITDDLLLNRMFGPDATAETDEEALKYGLALARRNVRLLGGEIALEYRDGDVTAITITLPLKKVASEIVMPSQNDEKAAGAA